MLISVDEPFEAVESVQLTEVASLLACQVHFYVSCIEATVQLLELLLEFLKLLQTHHDIFHPCRFFRVAHLGLVDFLLGLRDELPDTFECLEEYVCRRGFQWLASANFLDQSDVVLQLCAELLKDEGLLRFGIKLLPLPPFQSLVDGDGPVPVADHWVLDQLQCLPEEYKVKTVIYLALLVHATPRFDLTVAHDLRQVAIIAIRQVLALEEFKSPELLDQLINFILAAGRWLLL